jgi:hypothetical protein
MGKLFLVVFPRMDYYDNIWRWYIWYELIKICKYCVLKREVIDENTISRDKYAKMKTNIAKKGEWPTIPTNLQQEIKNTQLLKLQNSIQFPLFFCIEIHYGKNVWTLTSYHHLHVFQKGMVLSFLSTKRIATSTIMDHFVKNTKYVCGQQ